ncbi:MAG: ABC transporter ATP-binding protein/permease [Treponemataceae bacterium]|nr:ABC transporter ATP-binding protein/permease [Treponemataceae bacterium]
MVNSYKDDEKLKEVSKMRTILRLLSYLLKYKGRIAIVFLLIAIGTFVSLINPLFMEKGIDTYIANKDMPGFLRLMAIALGANLIMVIAVKIRMMIMAKLTNKVIEEIRDQLYVHIQSLDLSFFDSRPSGKILARITGDVNALKDVLENAITNLIPNFVTVIAVAVIMITKNAKLAAASLFGLPVLIAGVAVVSRKAHNYWQLNSKKNSNLSAFINEDLSGIKVVQGFTAESETNSTFVWLVTECRNAFIKAVRWADANFAIIDFSWGLCTFALYFIGIKVMGVENVSIGTYVAFGSYIGMFWQPINALSQFYNQLITAIAKAERIFEILDTKPGITDAEDAETLGTIRGDVEFKDVTFGYEGVNPVTGAVIKSARNVLEHTDFTVKAGETIALVGPTGAGKSTIVNLISRFYDIQDGQILVDGKDIKHVTLESLRSQMGIMTQDNYIFSGTIRDNIRYGKLDATEEEILAAAKSVHAHDFITALPDGYDTKLTSRGGELSNGQRQLLAFARTMISMPKILILDEATSSIDTQTEKLVQQGIKELLKGRTSFVIAHRLSTIQNADRIFVVDKGGILESGTPEELLQLKGEYYKLLEAAKNE